MRRLLIIIGLVIFILWLAKPSLVQMLSKQKWLSSITSQNSQITTQATQQLRNVGYYLEDKSQGVLGDSFSLHIVTKPPQVEITKTVPKKHSRNIILIDYLTSKAITLNLAPKVNYYLDIRNLPEGSCFFINQDSFTVPRGEYLKVFFPQTSKYKMYFDQCDREAKKFGEIIVQ